VKEFLKLVKIWQTYCPKFGGLVFWNTVYNWTINRHTDRNIRWRLWTYVQPPAFNCAKGETLLKVSCKISDDVVTQLSVKLQARRFPSKRLFFGPTIGLAQQACHLSTVYNNLPKQQGSWGPWEVLENRVGPWKSLKSPWIWMFHILKFLHIICSLLCHQMS